MCQRGQKKKILKVLEYTHYKTKNPWADSTCDGRHDTKNGGDVFYNKIS